MPGVGTGGLNRAFIPPNSGDPGPFFVTGQVVDLSGAPIGSANVFLFDTLTNLLVGTTVSNADGSWSLLAPSPRTTYYAVGYLPGSPDRAGTTVDTLQGS